MALCQVRTAPRTRRARHSLACLPAKHSWIALFPVRDNLVSFLRDDHEQIRSAGLFRLALPLSGGVVNFDDSLAHEICLRIAYTRDQRTDVITPTANQVPVHAGHVFNESPDLLTHRLARAGHHYRVEGIVSGMRR